MKVAKALDILFLIQTGVAVSREIAQGIQEYRAANNRPPSPPDRSNERMQREYRKMLSLMRT